MSEVPSAARRVPRVSIGLPVYNGERYLAEAIEALLAQTFDDFELILCDNASTDRTEAIARHYVALDPRVRYVRHPSNIGLARNYRHAFELATADYFKWATYDDVCGPRLLEVCVEVLDRQPEVVLVHSKAKIIDAGSKVLREYEDGLHIMSARPSVRFRELQEKLGLCHVLYGVIRSTALRRTGLLGTFEAADVVLLEELILQGAFWQVSDFQFYRRLHPGDSYHLEVLDEAQLYDPSARSRALFTSVWRRRLETWRAVLRAPLRGSERRHLIFYLTRMTFWECGGARGRDLVLALRRTLGSMAGRS